MILNTILAIIFGAQLSMLLPGAGDSPTNKTWRCSVPTPKDFERDSVIEAYKTGAESNGWICIPDPVEWWQVKAGGVEASKSYAAKQWQRYLIDQHRPRVFVQLDPYPPPRKGTLASKLPPELAGKTFASKEVRDAFVAESLARAEWFDADHICLAMEINAYFIEQPEDFAHFLTLLAETREALRRQDKDIVVSVSIQYEFLLGLVGEPKPKPHWEVIAKLDPYIDALGISTYPQGAGFKDPEVIPDDYYARIREHTDKPVVFAELGWSCSSRYGGSEASQAAFLRRFDALTRDLDVRLVNYFFLFDTKAFGPFFDGMGLLDSSGRAKEAFYVWKELWDRR